MAGGTKSTGKAGRKWQVPSSLEPGKWLLVGWGCMGEGSGRVQARYGKIGGDCIRVLSGAQQGLGRAYKGAREVPWEHCARVNQVCSEARKDEWKE